MEQPVSSQAGEASPGEAEAGGEGFEWHKVSGFLLAEE